MARPGVADPRYGRTGCPRPDLSCHVHWWGTPSTLTPRILSRLLEALVNSSTGPYFERALNLDPAIMNAEKLAVLSRHGFQNFSFGIQTLNAGVNADHNRGPQSVEMVARRFEELRTAGIQDVAGDILLGSKGPRPKKP